MQFQYDYDFEKHDSRSNFANYACRLFIKGNNFSIYSSNFEDIQYLFDYFDEHVRNIYELISSEIPLFGLYQLKKYGKENWGFSEEEYNEALSQTYEACEKFYLM
jgi:hypothetical protein